VINHPKKVKVFILNISSNCCKMSDFKKVNDLLKFNIKYLENQTASNFLGAENLPTTITYKMLCGNYLKIYLIITLNLTTSKTYITT
jgi:hypothetical protein